MRIRETLSAAALLLMLGGCAVGTVADASKDIERTRNDAEDLRETAIQPLPRADVSPVRMHDGVWLGSKAQRRDSGDPLPRVLERDGVTFVQSEPMELADIAEMITRELGIQTLIDPDVRQALVGQRRESDRREQQEAERNEEGTAIPALPPLDAPIMESLGVTEVAQSRSDVKMTVNHSGRLSTFLDLVGAKFDVVWAYEDGRIRFFKNLTRTFLVKTLPSENEIQMEIDTSSGTSGGDGGSSSVDQSSTTTARVNIWEDIEKGLSQIVDENAGRIHVSPGTGTITVSAPPSTIRQVDRFVRTQNDRFRKQVAISVQVLNVVLSDEDQYSLDISAMFSSLGGRTSLGLEGPAGKALESGTGLNWSILDTAGGRLSEEGVIRALSTRGDVSVVTSASATTLNNIPTPLQVGNMRDYVAEIGVDRDEEGMTVDLSTRRVNVGFNMQILPRVIDDGRILLQYNLSQSELAGEVAGFDVFEYQDQRIQLANINNRSFSQQVEIPNGSTLVLAGFEQTRSAVAQKGTGTPDNMLLGGNQEGSMSREIMVVLISPILLDASSVIVELSQ